MPHEREAFVERRKLCVPMRYVLGNAFREYRIRMTNPVLPLWDVLVPVIYLLIFGASFESWIGGDFSGGGGASTGADGAVSMVSGGAPDFVTFFLAGVLGMVTFGIALNSSYAFFEDMQSGMFHELMTYPFARRDLLLGKLLFNALFSVVGGALCVVAAITLLGVRLKPTAAPHLLLWTLLGMAGWYFLFSWLAVRMRGFNAYHTTSSTAYLLLMFVSNLFYPVERLPKAIQALAWLNPITWQVDLMRWASYGAGDPAILRLEAMGFVIFVGTTFWLANRGLNGPIE
jgi:ABC-2 type transport system permease protein